MYTLVIHCETADCRKARLFWDESKWDLLAKIDAAGWHLSAGPSIRVRRYSRGHRPGFCAHCAKSLWPGCGGGKGS